MSVNIQRAACSATYIVGAAGLHQHDCASHVPFGRHTTTCCDALGTGGHFLVLSCFVCVCVTIGTSQEPLLVCCVLKFMVRCRCARDGPPCSELGEPAQRSVLLLSCEQGTLGQFVLSYEELPLRSSNCWWTMLNPWKNLPKRLMHALQPSPGHSTKWAAPFTSYLQRARQCVECTHTHTKECTSAEECTGKPHLSLARAPVGQNMTVTLVMKRALIVPSMCRECAAAAILLGQTSCE